MTTLRFFNHTGPMPCPVCGILNPHLHECLDGGHFGAARDPSEVQPYTVGLFATQALVERQRQQDVEGLTSQQDAVLYKDGQLQRAAAAYALFARSGSISPHSGRPMLPPDDAVVVKALWPWDWARFRPKNRRDALVKAAALLIAEGDRQDLVTAEVTRQLERGDG